MYAAMRLGKDSRVTEIVERILKEYRPEEKCGYSVFVIGEEYFVEAEEAYQVGNMPRAEEQYKKAAAVWDINRLITEDPKHQALATYYTGRIFQTLGKYEKAIAYYQETKEKWPTFEKMQWVELGLAVCYQKLGQDRQAAIFYNQAVLKDVSSAAAVREEPGFLSGDSYCGAYAVWHLLRHYGNPVPIETLIEQMGIRQKGYSTLQDISDVLFLFGISTQAMQIPPEKASEVKLPFVQYRLPPKEGMLGHFVLCIPQQEHVLILDGPKETRLIPCTMLRQEQEGIWDGTLLLIQTQRQEYLERLLTEQISWQAAVHAAYVWFVKEDADVSEIVEGIQRYYAELSRQQMQAIRGGTVNYECQKPKEGRRCWTAPTCQSNKDCSVGQPVCSDGTSEYLCLPTKAWRSCEYLTAHNCGPKKTLSGNCFNGSCVIWPYTTLNDYCGTWMRRCK
ncbi:MAG: cysteine peptidase family C39 domain-containing protein [Anaerohalosphaeraceae bacterium]